MKPEKSLHTPFIDGSGDFDAAVGMGGEALDIWSCVPVLGAVAELGEAGIKAAGNQNLEQGGLVKI